MIHLGHWITLQQETTSKLRRVTLFFVFRIPCPLILLKCIYKIPQIPWKDAQGLWVECSMRCCDLVWFRSQWKNSSTKWQNSPALRAVYIASDAIHQNAVMVLFSSVMFACPWTSCVRYIRSSPSAWFICLMTFLVMPNSFLNVNEVKGHFWLHRSQISLWCFSLE